jgi:hypothetical protein
MSAISRGIPRRLPRPFPVLALEVLANSGREGCSQSLMLAHGFTFELVLALVRTGFASLRAERVISGTRTMDVIKVRITDAGRRAFETIQ